MHRIIKTLAIGILLATSVPAFAVDGLDGSVSVSAQSTGKDSKNAKYREYWYDMQNATAVGLEGAVNYQLPGTDYYGSLGLGGRSGLTEKSTEPDASLVLGEYGLFKVSGEYTRIGHVYAFDSKTIYNGIGTGNLGIDPNVRTSTKMPVGGWTSGKSPVAYPSATSWVTILDDYESRASLVDLMIRRDRVSTRVEGMPLMPASGLVGRDRASALVLGVNFDGEWRSGNYPFMANFGMGQQMEVPKTIDYQTVDVSADLGYNDSVPLVLFDMPVVVEVGAGRSHFRNSLSALSFENPLQTDQYRSATAFVTSGRFSVEPDNRADNANASLSLGFPMQTRLSANASRSFMTSNADLLPISTVTTYSDALPRSTSEAKVMKDALEVSLSTSPVDKYRVTTKYKYEQHQNLTEEFTLDRFGASDGSWNTRPNKYGVTTYNPMSSEYVSWIRRTAELEQEFEVGNKSAVTAVLENERESFIDGSADKANVNAIKLAYDTRAIDWATVRVSGERSAKETDYPDYAWGTGELTKCRKFYAADRNREVVNAMTTVHASPEMDVSLSRVQTSDDYLHTVYGLQNDKTVASTVGGNYNPSDRVSFDVFYTFETTERNMKSRQWTATVTGGGNAYGDPWTVNYGTESPSDWTEKSLTSTNIFGMTTNMVLLPQTVSMQVSGVFTASDGMNDYESRGPVVNPPSSATSSTYFVPAAYAPENFDNDAFIPEDILTSDETKSIELGANVKYNVGSTFEALKGLAVLLGYQYNFWNYRDAVNDTYSNVGRGYSSGLASYKNLLGLDTLYKDYENHTVYVKANYSF